MDNATDNIKTVNNSGANTAAEKEVAKLHDATSEQSGVETKNTTAKKETVRDNNNPSADNDQGQDKTTTISKGPVKKSAAPAYDINKKTTGEKWYRRLSFSFAEFAILIATALIAYIARYNEGSWLNKITKKSDQYLQKKIGHIGKRHEVGKRLASNIADTTVTFWGGTVFAPLMYLIHNKKKDIVAFFNRKFGKDGEEEAGNERLKDEPKKTWGSVITGRLVAWLTVFSSFTAADFALGKSKKNGEYHFKNYVEGFGKATEHMWSGKGITGKFKKAWDAMPWKDSAKKFTAYKGNKANKYGRILALDIFATTAAILIWEGVIKHFSKKKKKVNQEEFAETSSLQGIDNNGSNNTTATINKSQQQTSHTDVEMNRRKYNSDKPELAIV